MKKINIAVAGAGFAGAVLARELAESGRFFVSVFDERNHVAGNCHTPRDEKTGIRLHQYGPHIFNTSRDDVWKYVNQWSEFIPFVNRVKAVTEKGIFALPINLLTINQFYRKTMSPSEAKAFISQVGDQSISEPQSFEDQALKFLGHDLYETFFYGYTKKQWGCEPKELPASILKRLPVRFNYDDNYYNQKYQGLPKEGYTTIVEKILDHSDIKVYLNQKITAEVRENYEHLFWSGPVDAFFNFSHGRLKYRTLKFERFEADGDFQGNPVINYCEEKIPFTRISEHKHFSFWEEHEKTICFREYSAEATETDTPYYPLRLNQDKDLLSTYVHLAQKEKKVSFIGRLGTYRYLDMHVVIGESLDFSKTCLQNEISTWPQFHQNPLA